jgi:hypothetical protein
MFKSVSMDEILKGILFNDENPIFHERIKIKKFKEDKINNPIEILRDFEPMHA